MLIHFLFNDGIDFVFFDLLFAGESLHLLLDNELVIDNAVSLQDLRWFFLLHYFIFVCLLRHWLDAQLLVFVFDLEHLVHSLSKAQVIDKSQRLDDLGDCFDEDPMAHDNILISNLVLHDNL